MVRRTATARSDAEDNDRGRRNDPSRPDHCVPQHPSTLRETNSRVKPVLNQSGQIGIVVQEPLLSGLAPGDFARYQNFGRAQKLGIGVFFERYDRILQVDDTCIFSPATRLYPHYSPTKNRPVKCLFLWEGYS